MHPSAVRDFSECSIIILESLLTEAKVAFYSSFYVNYFYNVTIKIDIFQKEDIYGHRYTH